MKIIKECEERKLESKRVAEYRKLAELEEGMAITEDNLNNWALRRVCRIYNCSEDSLKEELGLQVALTEATLKDEAEKEANKAKKDLGNPVVVIEKSQIERELDRALDHNQEQNELGSRNFVNVLFIGEAGTGKTTIIRRWAKENNVNLFEVRAAGMDDTDLGGAMAPDMQGQKVVRLASTEFDKLDRPNSVLFLDEYNRAPQSVRTNLLELINSHMVPDPREESGQRYMPNFLFTIAAINPANPDYNTDRLDMAELTRFKHVDVIAEPKNLLHHLLNRELKDQLEKASNDQRKKKALGRMELAKAILGDDSFEFDTRKDIERSQEDGNGLALNYRTFTQALMASDGTKKDFLDNFSSFCNNQKLNMVKAILADYEDIDDKANSVFKKGKDTPTDNASKLLAALGFDD